MAKAEKGNTMRRSTHLTCITIMSLALMSLSATPSAFGYPPDNAAVLYYKAAQLCQIDDEMGNALRDFRKSKIALDDKIRELVKKNREATIALLDACEVKDCDWGINYTRGFELMPPRYATLRQLSTLVVAEAKIHVQDGGYRTALGRCLSLHKMAGHINDRLFISHLVGISINEIAHTCMSEILSIMPPDTETLTWLKTELMKIENLPLPIELALDGERQAGAVSMTVDRMAAVSEVGFGDEAFQKTVLEKVRAGDEAFFATNRAAWIAYWDEAAAAFDLPYPQAHPQLKRVYEQHGSNPDAILMAHLAPTCGAMCTHWTKSRTHYNAMRIAIDLYLAKAQTGRLPDALPANAPNDLFSGKPFRYEKATDGFILHCQGKDLDKDKVYEYEFKIRK